MEKYVLEFSNESSEAVTEVLRSAEDIYSNFKIISRHRNVVIVESEKSWLSEFAFLNSGTRILKEFETLESLDTKMLPAGSFHVRKRDYTNSDHITESDIGEALKGTRTISFKNYDFIVKAVKTDQWYLGILEYTKDSKGMNSRRAPLRPFFSPVTIHPKFARFLVNLSRTKPGELILDPFCGTGGILIEAGLMGRRVTGSDASLEMVKGARLNLKYYSLNGEVQHSDFMSVNTDSKVDAIATDLPYGKNSELTNYDIDSLYAAVFPRFHDLIKENGHLALVISDMDLLKYSDGFFSIVSNTAFRQHRSLTRYFLSMLRI